MLNTPGPGDAGGGDARVGEVVGVHELVAVDAVAEHDRVGAVGDPVEQDAEDAEPTVAEDRARPHDRHVEPVARRRRGTPTRRRAWRGRTPPPAWARWWAAPGWSRARRTRRSTTCARPCRRRRAGAASSSTRVPSTLTVRSSSWSLASGTWATLWNTTSTPVDRRRRRRPRSRMSPRDELDTGGGRSPASAMSSTRTVSPRAEQPLRRAATRSSRCRR